MEGSGEEIWVIENFEIKKKIQFIKVPVQYQNFMLDCFLIKYNARALALAAEFRPRPTRSLRLGGNGSFRHSPGASTADLTPVINPGGQKEKKAVAIHVNVVIFLGQIFSGRKKWQREKKGKIEFYRVERNLRLIPYTVKGGFPPRGS